MNISLRKVATIATALTAIGGAIVLYQTHFRPYKTIDEVDALERSILKVVEESGEVLKNSNKELELSIKANKERSCLNKISALKRELYQAQVNEFEANEKNDGRLALFAIQAQQDIKDDIDNTKEECK